MLGKLLFRLLYRKSNERTVILLDADRRKRTAEEPGKGRFCEGERKQRAEQKTRGAGRDYPAHMVLGANALQRRLKGGNARIAADGARVGSLD
ncbi:hypothetical protein SDC9_82011 [bioreactor metagenome]|uniref:Uncharacterized protein n=1 Tax=bioreactor metagenome TaxID=1076179 RepID=A0A644Z4C5_9ZZZZ